MPPLLSDAKFWVLVAFALFLALLYKKGGKTIARALDQRSARIQSELEEAVKLREEAERVLASYRQKQKESLKEAETILVQARRDAQTLRADAEKDLKEALEARARMAMEKIAQQEASAIQEVQHHVIDISTAAARAIIMEHLAKGAGDDLVKLALTDIERKIH